MPSETTREKRRRATVLLVDDIRSARILGEQILRRHGYQVISVESADEALKLLHDRRDFSCVVSDWRMPGGDGVSLLEAVGNWYRLPRVLWTVDDEVGCANARRLGIACVSKHDPPSKLVDAVRAALGHTPPGAA